jgi:hypothetical protein
MGNESAGILTVSRRTVARLAHGSPPLFYRVMKGSTHMPDSHDAPLWTPQHMRALFRVFTTPASPDFQRQILEHAAQLQPQRARPRREWRAPRPWWHWCYTWGIGTPQVLRRVSGRVFATVACCGLALGISLAWWAVHTEPLAPIAPEERISCAVSPQGGPLEMPHEARMRGDLHATRGTAAPHDAAGRATVPLEASEIAPSQQAGHLVDRHMAAETGAEHARPLLMPVLVPQRYAWKDSTPPTRSSSPRVRRPRVAPDKSARPPKRMGTGKRTPA